MCIKHLCFYSCALNNYVCFCESVVETGKSVVKMQIQFKNNLVSIGNRMTPGES